MCGLLERHILLKTSKIHSIGSVVINFEINLKNQMCLWKKLSTSIGDCQQNLHN
jgi:hypothetical protein